MKNFIIIYKTIKMCILPIRKAVIGIIFFAGLISPTLAQLDKIDFLKGGIDDSNLLFTEYLRPYANILGANLSAGWYNTAKAHKPGGFDITITLNAAWAPPVDRLFKLSDLSLSPDASVIGDPETPTIAGRKTETRPEIVYSRNISGIGEIEYARYTLPNGTNLHYLPLPMVQAGIGLPLGTELTARFLPSLDLGESGNIGLWGVGLKHSISQYIPVLKELPVVDISLQGGYSKLSTYANINYDPMDIVSDQAYDYVNDMNVWLNQKLKLNIEALTANLIISESLSVISFYQGIGYSSSKVNLKLSGYYPFPIIETTGPNIGKVVVNDVEGEGKIKDPVDLNMHNNENLRLNAGMCIKLGVLTIHLDYTRANYNIVTAGIGISFR